MRVLFFFLLVSFNLPAANFEVIPDYFVRYEKDKYPFKEGSRIKILCEFDSDYNLTRELRFGMNGSNERVEMSDKNEVIIIRKVQKAVFQFYYDSNFQEIETDSIEVKPGMITVISLHFKARNEPRSVKKPVIYLYPESDMEISVDLKARGNLTFTYPEYSQGWKGIAHPDGSISINGRNYPYLFWESEQHFNTFDPGLGGFLLTKETVLSALEKHLSDFGFNDREKTDFITFWAPQLQKYEQVYIQFIRDEACNQFAHLEVEPKPQHVNRIYMIWTSADYPRKVFMKPEKIEKMNRDGFDVLEWGGIELNEAPKL